MRRPESHAGSWGWLGLAAYVLAVDLLGAESLTHAAQRARATKVGRIAVPGLIVYTGLHLVNGLPRDYDLFYKVMDLKHERPVDL